MSRAGAAARVILCALLALVVLSQTTVAKADGHSRGGSPSPRPSAEAPPDGEAREVSIQLSAGHESELQVKVFPAEGVAVVEAYEGRGVALGRNVAYAIAISPAPFEGSVDLDFPDLGKIVGTITPNDPRGPAAQAKLCEGRYPVESATFEGHLAFSGAGGQGSWKTQKTEAGIHLACGVDGQVENGKVALFHHVAEFGPTLSGPVPIRLFAHGEISHRVLELFAWGGRPRGVVEFDAVDREWLPGEVAAERWVQREGASLKTLAIRGGSEDPTSVRFAPPAPFFGKGTYRRNTGELTGSLGVSFLGLKLRLTPSPLTANLEDEEDLAQSRAREPAFAPRWLVPLRQ